MGGLPWSGPQTQPACEQQFQSTCHIHACTTSEAGALLPDETSGHRYETPCSLWDKRVCISLPFHDVSGGQRYSGAQRALLPCSATLSQGWRLPCHTSPRARWQGAWTKGKAAVPKHRSDPEVIKRPGMVWACLEEASTSLGVLTTSGGVCAYTCWPRGWKGISGP